MITLEKLCEGLRKLKFPVAYYAFSEGDVPDMPYVVYVLPETDNFAADGIVYYKNVQVNIELYTKGKDFESEEKIERFFAENEIYFTRNEECIDNEMVKNTFYITL